MNALSKSFLFLSVGVLLAVGCTEPIPVEPTEPVTPVDTTEEPTPVVHEWVADHESGDTLYFNVKIAVDKKTWETLGSDVIVPQIESQWKKITKRFNAADKNNKLLKEYVFTPDIWDILVYEGCSYWGGKGFNAARKQLDTKIFKVMVIYDGCYGDFGGEYGGGCGEDNGINTILVINASASVKNKVQNPFNDTYTYRAITHELGHFRGVIDLYAEVVQASKNEVNGEAFMPTDCIMNNHCYTSDNEAVWSDYALNFINKAGIKKIPNTFGKFFSEQYPANIQFSVVRDEVPVEGAVINLYGMEGYSEQLKNEVYASFTTDSTGVVVIDNVKALFSEGEAAWHSYGRWFGFLVETVIGEEKSYFWMPDYEVQNITFYDEETFFADL